MHSPSPSYPNRDGSFQRAQLCDSSKLPGALSPGLERCSTLVMQIDTAAAQSHIQPVPSDLLLQSSISGQEPAEIVIVVLDGGHQQCSVSTPDVVTSIEIYRQTPTPRDSAAMLSGYL